jgi:hypothetical protein
MKFIETLRYVLGGLLLIGAGAIACSNAVLDHKHAGAKKEQPEQTLTETAPAN